MPLKNPKIGAAKITRPNLFKLKFASPALSIRIAIWNGLSQLVTVVLLVWLSYSILATSMNERDMNVIQIVSRNLLVAYENGGKTELQKVNENLAHSEATDSFFVRVIRNNGTVEYFNDPEKWKEFSIDSPILLHSRGRKERFFQNSAGTVWKYFQKKDDEDILEFIEIPLKSGSVLQVGRSSGNRELFLEQFSSSIAAALLPTLLLSGLGVWIVAKNALKPLRRLVSTLDAILAGNLNARVEPDAKDDELSKLSHQFNEMLSRNQKLIAGMQETLECVAHDLRTPLARMRVSAEQSIEENQSRENLQSLLGDCFDEAERLEALVKTLLDVAESSTGGSVLNKQLVEVNKTLEGMAEFFEYSLEEKSIQLKIKCQEGLWIRADSTKFLQILSNLLENAVKYTPENGQITIEAFQEKSNTTGLKIVVIEVGDNGIGISESDRHRIFDRLFRSDRSRHEKGLGLGLSLVKAFTEQMGGTVVAKSTFNVGSLFRLEFPEAGS